MTKRHVITARARREREAQRRERKEKRREGMRKSKRGRNLPIDYVIITNRFFFVTALAHVRAERTRGRQG